MKKLLFIAIAFAAFCGTAQAQYKPVKGTFATEVSFNPFALFIEDEISSPTIALPDLGIKGRYFFAENLAGRLSLSIGYASNTNHTFTDPGTSPEVEQIVNNSRTIFGIAPGIEYHFGDWEKVSLYCGAELGLMIVSSSASIENAGFVQGYNIDISGANIEIPASDENLINPSSTGFGMGVFTGFDYYFTKSLFVGVELGFSFLTASEGEVEITSASVTTTSKNYNSSTSLGFYCEPAIRLGWRF